MGEINIGWPEGIMLGFILLSLIIHASQNGKPMNQEYNFGLRLIAAGISLSLLYWGGFFN